MGFPGGARGKEPACQCRQTSETKVQSLMKLQSLSWADPLEEGMATHSSILAWRIPWREEPSRLQSIGLQSWTWLSDLAHTHTHTHTHTQDCSTAISTEVYTCTHPSNGPSIHTPTCGAKLPSFLTRIFAIAHWSPVPIVAFHWSIFTL